MAGEAALAKLAMERNLAFVGTVGNNAPFVGLLGTVIGIIRAFHELDASGGQVSAGLMSRSARRSSPPPSASSSRSPRSPSSTSSCGTIRARLAPRRGARARGARVPEEHAGARGRPVPRREPREPNKAPVEEERRGVRRRRQGVTWPAARATTTTRSITADQRHARSSTSCWCCLIILMVTASYIVSKSIPMDLPNAAERETGPAPDPDRLARPEGKLYVDAEPTTWEAAPGDGAQLRALETGAPRGHRGRSSGRATASSSASSTSSARRASRGTRSTSTPPTSTGPAATERERPLGGGAMKLRFTLLDSRV